MKAARRAQWGSVHDSVRTGGDDGAEFTILGPYAAHGEFAAKETIGLQMHAGHFTLCGSISRDEARRLGELLIAAADDDVSTQVVKIETTAVAS